MCVIFFSARRIYPHILQVDGFEYVCVLGGATLPAAYNATDGSVACTVGESVVRELSYAPHTLQVITLIYRSQVLQIKRQYLWRWSGEMTLFNTPLMRTLRMTSDVGYLNTLCGMPCHYQCLHWQVSCMTVHCWPLAAPPVLLSVPWASGVGGVLQTPAVLWWRSAVLVTLPHPLASVPVQLPPQ